MGLQRHNPRKETSDICAQHAKSCRKRERCGDDVNFCYVDISKFQIAYFNKSRHRSLLYSKSSNIDCFLVLWNSKSLFFSLSSKVVFLIPSRNLSSEKIAPESELPNRNLSLDLKAPFGGPLSLFPSTHPRLSDMQG